MDVDRNEFVPIEGEEHAKELDQKRLGRIEQFKESLGALTAKTMKEGGPTVFQEGEIIVLKGYKFRVGRVDPNKLILRPVKI